MKRARKNSFFSKKENKKRESYTPYSPEKDEPITEVIPDMEDFGEEEAFAIGEDVSVAEKSFEPSEPEAFAVSEDVFATIGEEALDPGDTPETTYDAAPDMDFSDASSDDPAEESPDRDTYEDIYDTLPDSQIPFSTEDYTSENTEESIEENPVPSEDFLLRKKQNREKWEKKRRKKRITTICIGVFLLFIITAFGLLGVDFSGTSGEDFLTPVDTATGKLNVLLLGVDKDGERSDSIMLVTYNFDDKSVNLMSIPRDTKIYVSDRGVTRKITEVHGMHNSSGKMYGAAAVAEAVTGLTGIPINYYLEFSFSAIDNVMDILGPVTFDVPDIEGGGRGMNYDDDFQDLHIHLKPGVQELSGNQIQQFLRYRKSNYGTSDGSDISRISRQQELLKAIIDQKINISLIIKIPDIFKELKSQIKTNFSARDIIKYAGYLKDLSSDNMNSHVLPGEDAKSGGIWYYICDFKQTADLVTNSFGYTVTSDELTNKISLTGKATTGKTTAAKSNSQSQAANKSEASQDKTEDKEEPDENSSASNSSIPSGSSTGSGPSSDDNSSPDLPDSSDDSGPDSSQSDSQDNDIISLD